MPLVLALEPDLRQAEALTPIVEQRVGAELVLVSSERRRGATRSRCACPI